LNPHGWDRVNPVSDDARLGTVIHHALARWHTEVPDLDVISDKFQVEKEMLSMGYFRGERVLRTFPRVEMHVEELVAWDNGANPSIELTGHPDLWFTYVDPDGMNRLVVVDWKLKSIEGKMPQLWGYAWCIYWHLLAQGLTTVDRIQLVLVSLLDEDYIMAETLDPMSDLQEQIGVPLLVLSQLRGGSFSPSWGGCRWCDLRHDCTAYQKWAGHELNIVRFAIRGLDEHPELMREMIESHALPAIYDSSKGLASIGASLNEKLKFWIKTEGEFSSGGRKFFIEEQSAGRFVNLLDEATRKRALQLPVFWDGVGEVGLKGWIDALVAIARGEAKRAPKGSKEFAETNVLGLFTEEQIIQKTRETVKVEVVI